jgi:pimeloyl-ACP methyl ester carboxylesterase
VPMKPPADSSPTRSGGALPAWRATGALVVQAVHGITDLVEDVHASILQLRAPLGSTSRKVAPTRGLTRLVYRSVRGVTQVVGWGVDKGLGVVGHPALAPSLAPLMERMARMLRLKRAEAYREPVQAALNGILGDHLQATGSALAIKMSLRQQGLPLKTGTQQGKLVFLLHGLCMNDLQWLREGHDHGQMLAQELGFEAVYLHYNTGRSIHDNGREFADLLQERLSRWPVPVTQLVLVGHSMGGLVARSACHHAAQSGQDWLKPLTHVVTLGSPHAGAPLERAGSKLDFLLGISPYTAPFARLGLIRSAGIQDLRHGHITAERQPPIWPRHVKLYAMAATKQKSPAVTNSQAALEAVQRWLGDGLVPVKSALGLEHKPHLGLPLLLPASRRALVHETDHFGLLSSPQVAQQLLKWLR